MAVVGVDYESGCGNKITVSPAFYVAEAYELVAVKGYYCLASGYFCRNIIGRTACYTCAALKGRFVDQCADALGVDCVFRLGKRNFNIIRVHFEGLFLLL